MCACAPSDCWSVCCQTPQRPPVAWCGRAPLIQPHQRNAKMTNEFSAHAIDSNGTRAVCVRVGFSFASSIRKCCHSRFHTIYIPKCHFISIVARYCHFIFLPFFSLLRFVVMNSRFGGGWNGCWHRKCAQKKPKKKGKEWARVRCLADWGWIKLQPSNLAYPNDSAEPEKKTALTYTHTHTYTCESQKKRKKHSKRPRRYEPNIAYKASR